MRHTLFNPRYLRQTALAGLVAGLAACATPPPDTEASANTAGSPPDTVAPKTSAAEPRGTLAALREELTATGVTVSDTPEGHLKVSIPGDTSFGLGRTTVGPAFGRLLNSMADALNKHPNTVIEIVGHTDATGTDAVNLAVSKRRAESTRDHLVGRNVAADRIKTQGWGSDQPVADNNTAQGRAANRRVEIFVSER
jgi:outer membrane protein OmpA-like peptidoglycan-associated protein